MLGYGVDSIGKDGRLNTDGPEAIAAAEMYQKLVRDNGPAGVVGFNWYECQALYMQGKAAMWIDTSSVGALTADPAKSKMAASAGFVVMPPGPKVHRAPVFASGVGIAAASKKIGPSWFWVQWATGKAMQTRQVAGGYGASGRSSPFEAARKSTEAKLNAEWLDAVLKSTAIAYPVLPDIVAGSEFRDVYGVALTNMLAPGANPAAELKKATETFKPILEKSEKA
jgi:multiple sugar transport system substrate-binding protein